MSARPMPGRPAHLADAIKRSKRAGVYPPRILTRAGSEIAAPGTRRPTYISELAAYIWSVAAACARAFSVSETHGAVTILSDEARQDVLKFECHASSASDIVLHLKKWSEMAKNNGHFYRRFNYAARYSRRAYSQ